MPPRMGAIFGSQFSSCGRRDCFRVLELRTLHATSPLSSPVEPIDPTDGWCPTSNNIFHLFKTQARQKNPKSIGSTRRASASGRRGRFPLGHSVPADFVSRELGLKCEVPVSLVKDQHSALQVINSCPGRLPETMATAGDKGNNMGDKIREIVVRFSPPNWGSRQFRWATIALFVTLMFLPSYFSNALGTAERDFFSNWQQDSQALVLGAIDERDNSGSLGFWGLTESRQVQIGTQGHLFTMLSRFSPLSDVRALEAVSSTFTAVAITVFSLVLFRLGSPWLAAFFVATALTSPWLVSAARNLYWIPWSWFAPAVIAGLIALTVSKQVRRFLYLAMFAAFAFRFGAGYEFMTSIILLAALMPFLANITTGNNSKITSSLRTQLLYSTKIVATALLAFVAVLTTHSFHRGNGSVTNGLGKIYREDVLRRTYGDPGGFDPVYEASLSASPFDVVYRYVLDWNTPVLHLPITDSFSIGLGTTGLSLLFVLVIASMALSLLLHKSLPRNTFILLIGALSVPLSWFILAKGHSYIHLHINYVLWYPITVPVLLYLALGIPSDLVRRSFIKLLRQPKLRSAKPT